MPAEAIASRGQVIPPFSHEEEVPDLFHQKEVEDTGKGLCLLSTPSSTFTSPKPVKAQAPDVTAAPPSHAVQGQPPNPHHLE